MFFELYFGFINKLFSYLMITPDKEMNFSDKQKNLPACPIDKLINFLYSNSAYTTQSEMICVFDCHGHEKYYVSCCYFQFQTKVKRGAWTIRDPCLDTGPYNHTQKNWVMGLILLNLGDCKGPVGSRKRVVSGTEWFSLGAGILLRG